MKRRLFLGSFLAVIFSFGSFGWCGGELPFPFDDETGAPVLASYSWEVPGTNLDVQVKILQAENGEETVKIWVRNDSGFVFSRTRIARQGDSATVAVQIAERAGQLTVDWGSPDTPSTLELDGQVFRLVHKSIR